MFQTIRNAWKIEDLRKKIIYTAIILLLFRRGAAIPVPYINITAADGLLSGQGPATMMTYLNMMTGDAFRYGTLFALTITPYINASIIMQLLGVAIPALERLQKEGEEGRKKIASITRFLTVGLGIVQSTAYYFYIRSEGFLMTDANDVAFTGFWMVFQAVVIVATLTAGTALIMWMGEQINEKGIGNGISLILFAGILSSIPQMAIAIWQYFDKGGAYYALAPISILIYLCMIGFVVWMDGSERRIPIQYAKRVVGRKMYGGQNTHMPIKVNMSGVMPVIFASSILSLPATFQLFITVKEGGFWEGFFKLFYMDNPFYAIIYFLLILFFAYFYTAIQYDPVEMANNLRKNSGAIPGIRPGKPTTEYFKRILSKITLLGALMLSVIAILPIIFSQITTAFKYPMNVSIGGTSLIIMVGVALETVKQLESQMMMRHYKGFLD